MWLTGLVAPRHVGSSQTRARTRVPCIGRQILSHCATREAPEPDFNNSLFTAVSPASKQCQVHSWCLLNTYLLNEWTSMTSPHFTALFFRSELLLTTLLTAPSSQLRSGFRDFHPRPTVSASLGNLLEMQICELQLRLESQEMRPTHLCFMKPSR